MIMIMIIIIIMIMIIMIIILTIIMIVMKIINNPFLLLPEARLVVSLHFLAEQK